MTSSTESSPLAVLDTNILVYALDAESPHHQASAALIATAGMPDATLCVTPQNLAEFHAIVTDSRRVKKPRPVENAVEAINGLIALPGLVVLPVPLDVVQRFMGLVQAHAIKGQRAFDAFLVATMLGNGVSRIWTYNASDFLLFEGIDTLVPQATVPE